MPLYWIFVVLFSAYEPLPVPNESLIYYLPDVCAPYIINGSAYYTPIALDMLTQKLTQNPIQDEKNINFCKKAYTKIACNALLNTKLSGGVFSKNFYLMLSEQSFMQYAETCPITALYLKNYEERAENILTPEASFKYETIDLFPYWHSLKNSSFKNCFEGSGYLYNGEKHQSLEKVCLNWSYVFNNLINNSRMFIPIPDFHKVEGDHNFCRNFYVPYSILELFKIKQPTAPFCFIAKDELVTPIKFKDIEYLSCSNIPKCHKDFDFPFITSVTTKDPFTPVNRKNQHINIDYSKIIRSLFFFAFGSFLIVLIVFVIILLFQNKLKNLSITILSRFDKSEEKKMLSSHNLKLKYDKKDNESLFSVPPIPEKFLKVDSAETKKTITTVQKARKKKLEAIRKSSQWKIMYMRNNFNISNIFDFTVTLFDAIDSVRFYEINKLVLEGYYRTRVPLQKVSGYIYGKCTIAKTGKLQQNNHKFMLNKRNSLNVVVKQFVFEDEAFLLKRYKLECENVAAMVALLVDYKCENEENYKKLVDSNDINGLLCFGYITEVSPYGTIYDFITGKLPFGWDLIFKEKFHVGHQIAEALMCLHEQGFVHGDVALRNCYIYPVPSRDNKKGILIKLGDTAVGNKDYASIYLGLPNCECEDCINNEWIIKSLKFWNGFVIPVQWIAPEIFVPLFGHYTRRTNSNFTVDMGQYYVDKMKLIRYDTLSRIPGTISGDIWSFGILVHELFSNGFPIYHNLSNLACSQYLFKKFSTTNSPYLMLNSLSDNLPLTIKSVIVDLCKFDEKQRILNDTKMFFYSQGACEFMQKQ